jgi:acetylornithine/LysW-gamma-L-lysine aminotransferase
MGATLIGERVGGLAPHSHGSTFGGNPLACAAGLAAIGYIEANQLVARSAELGEYVLGRLQRIESPLIREVRGRGLMVGVELKRKVTPILQGLLNRRVLALPAGQTVLRLLPPLVISRGDLDQVVAAIEATLAEAETAQEKPGGDEA